MLRLIALALVLSIGPSAARVGAVPAPTKEDETRDKVVLLHGLGRSDLSMAVLAYRLEQAGFDASTFDYPSTESSVEETAAALDRFIQDCCADVRTQLHFVTHSLGGIIVRQFLADHSESYEGRVVMLSPPNRGSELVDFLSDYELFDSTLGPAATELGTGEDSAPNRLGPVTFELGVITGNRSINPLASQLIPGEDDGKVSVESARVEGMADFLVLPTSHTFIMNDGTAAEEVIHFLEKGRFSDRRHDLGEAPP